MSYSETSGIGPINRYVLLARVIELLSNHVDHETALQALAGLQLDEDQITSLLSLVYQKDEPGTLRALVDFANAQNIVTNQMFMARVSGNIVTMFNHTSEISLLELALASEPGQQTLKEVISLLLLEQPVSAEAIFAMDSFQQSILIILKQILGPMPTLQQLVAQYPEITTIVTERVNLPVAVANAILAVIAPEEEKVPPKKKSENKHPLFSAMLRRFKDANEGLTWPAIAQAGGIEINNQNNILWGRKSATAAEIACIFIGLGLTASELTGTEYEELVQAVSEAIEAIERQKAEAAKSKEPATPSSVITSSNDLASASTAVSSGNGDGKVEDKTNGDGKDGNGNTETVEKPLDQVALRQRVKKLGERAVQVIINMVNSRPNRGKTRALESTPMHQWIHRNMNTLNLEELTALQEAVTTLEQSQAQSQ